MRCPHIDAATRGHGFHRVFEQVDQHLLDQTDVNLTDQRRRGKRDAETNPAALGLFRDEDDASANELVDVNHFVSWRRSAREARERAEQLPYLIELFETDVERLGDVWQL